ncbi:MAG: hypothetical protein RIR39_2761 [Pseudomonadota bacterium]
MNKITDYRRGGVHPRPFGCNHQDVAKTARDSGQPQGMQGQPQGIAPTGFALVWKTAISLDSVSLYRGYRLND